MDDWSAFSIPASLYGTGPDDESEAESLYEECAIDAESAASLQNLTIT